MSVKRLFITGYYGMRNTGDDGMAWCLTRGIHHFRPDVEILIAASSAIELPPDSKDRVEIVDRSPKNVIRHILDCDALMWGGGTSIFSYRGKSWKWYKMILRQLIMFRLARLLRKKGFFEGIGLGPFHSRLAEWLARKTIAATDHVSVRDSEALAYLQKWKLAHRATSSFDLTAILMSEYETQKIAPPSDKFVLGMSLLPYYEMFQPDQDKDPLLRDRIVEAIDANLTRHPDLEVRLFVFKDRNRDHDVDFIEDVQAHVADRERVRIVPYNPNPVQRLVEMGQCHAFMGMRLHSSIFAFLCDLPMVILNYHRKCPILHEQIGLPGDAILGLDDIEAGKMIEPMHRLVENRDHFRATYDRDEAERLAWRAIEELCKHL
ncbi:MAG: polysaccharide pyruvyl transferase family protein [Candidatus Sumerlaeia bacterium]